VFDPLSRLVRQYYNHTNGTVTTDQDTAGMKNVAVMDDLYYTIKTREYSRKISWYKTQLKVWEDNNVKEYTLVQPEQHKECRTTRLVGSGRSWRPLKLTSTSTPVSRGARLTDEY
jgi:hypothetical protein